MAFGPLLLGARIIVAATCFGRLTPHGETKSASAAPPVVLAQPAAELIASDSYSFVDPFPMEATATQSKVALPRAEPANREVAAMSERSVPVQ